MSEKKLNENFGNSSIKRIKAKSMLKKQRLAIVLLIAAILLLLVSLLVVNYLVEIFEYTDVDGTVYYIKKIDGVYALCNKDGTVLERDSEGHYLTNSGSLVIIDPKTGEWDRYAVVDTEGSEEIGYREYVLMFKQMTYDATSTKDASRIIQSIEVHNEYGTYSFVRGEGNSFEIKGHESTPFNAESFAQLAVACGYTISMRRLEEPERLPDGSIDYAEYGLASETRVRTETDEEGNETEIEYQYEPAWYIITNMKGESHKVIIGDLAVTGGGYYAKYEGREKIYILGTSGITDLLLKSVEAMVTPTIVYPMTATNCFNVYDFIIYDNIDYEAIVKALEEKYAESEAAGTLITEEELDKYYGEFFDKYSHKICHFSYRELKERQGTMYAYLPYVSKLDYADGYYINSSNIDKILSNLCDTDFTEVVKLNPTDEDFEKYGLSDSEYVITYSFKTKNDEGETVYITNYIEISKKNKDGVFYAYSDTYNMIVGISESSFGFLEWDELSWYDQSYIQMDIGHISGIVIESPELSVNFEIEDSASKYMTYVAQSSDNIKIGEKTYKVVKNSATGKFVLSSGDSDLSPVYDGDYLVTPLPYTAGTAQGADFLFYETKNVDVDENGTNDATAYYYYNVAYNVSKGGCYLTAVVTIVDSEGNPLGNSKEVVGDPYLTTDYFITNSNYLYLTGKDTYIGQKLQSVYGSVGRGNWGSGNLYVTADEKYVLVNSKTGEWSVLDDISCGIYFADSKTSRLAARAVEIPAKYDAAGKITRHPETYYPTTASKLQYDETSGGIQVYNSKNKTWGNATYEDCIIGVWNKGAYYVVEGNNLIVVNEETGDWGIVTVASNEKYIAEVIANGNVLDYIIQTTNYAGTNKYSYAMDNFKQFYGSMLYASLEGMAELTEEEKAALRQMDDFTSESGDEVCQLKITIYGQDLYGNRKDTVYRFYQYSERKSYITIEAISYEDGYASSSEEAYGNFYVLRTYADKIIEDAKKILNGEEVTAISKY